MAPRECTNVSFKRFTVFERKGSHVTPTIEGQNSFGSTSSKLPKHAQPVEPAKLGVSPVHQVTLPHVHKISNHQPPWHSTSSLPSPSSGRSATRKEKEKKKQGGADS